MKWKSQGKKVVSAITPVGSDRKVSFWSVNLGFSRGFNFRREVGLVEDARGVAHPVPRKAKSGKDRVLRTPTKRKTFLPGRMRNSIGFPSSSGEAQIGKCSGVKPGY